MSKTAIVFSCAHAKPDHNNDRALLLGNLMSDIQPDYVVDLGDTIDLTSLSTHERNPKALCASDYEADIESYLDFQDKMRWKIRKGKRKMPTIYGFEGNHENRLKRALAANPRVEGAKYGISWKHLETSRFYHEYTEYEHGGPGILNIDGVDYAHFFQNGGYGGAISGDNHGAALLRKRLQSSTCGHSHRRNVSFKDNTYPNPAIGLVAGCFKGGAESWAGQSNLDWWRGVVIKRNIEGGSYSPQFVTMEELEKAYG